MSTDVFAILIYSLNNKFIVRKCCSRGYTMHPLIEGHYRFYNCTCEILGSDLTKDEAVKLGQRYSEDMDVQLILD
ncbi:hypothetical protein [Bacillus massiliigorillae]|uniref:hypothetical protein n=1 Tax=Bacillus massiliigorillae TaxID=1243664 RepID=UPI0005A83880|nr:hypothetical protein [Bacillus massiliigorillae]